MYKVNWQMFLDLLSIAGIGAFTLFVLVLWGKLVNVLIQGMWLSITVYVLPIVLLCLLVASVEEVKTDEQVKQD